MKNNWINIQQLLRRDTNVKNEFICDCNIIHQEAVESTLKRMPDDNIFNKLAEFFKILGDTTRTKILLH